MKIIFLFLCPAACRQLVGTAVVAVVVDVVAAVGLLLSELCWFRNLFLVSCLHDTLYCKGNERLCSLLRNNPYLNKVMANKYFINIKIVNLYLLIINKLVIQNKETGSYQIYFIKK